MRINHNCCIKLVPLVIFIYDARSHIKLVPLVIFIYDARSHIHQILPTYIYQATRRYVQTNRYLTIRRPDTLTRTSYV